MQWQFQATPAQLPPRGEWQTLYYRGGRGSGKSFAASHVFAEMILASEQPGAWAIVAPTFGDARDKCVESEESGLLRALGTNLHEINAGTSVTVEKGGWNRSIGELHLKDGSTVHIDGADDGAYRIQGFSLRGCWADEIGLWKRWQTAWDESIAFALRKGDSKIVATGTPKRALPARQLVKRLIEEARTNPLIVDRLLRTSENWDNLSPTFRQSMERYAGTALGAQELEGMLLEVAEGALWAYSWIEDNRVEAIPHGGWQSAPRIGVDIASGKEGGDLHSYTVVAQHGDHHLYVVDHDAMIVTPLAFAKRVIDVARSQHGIIRLEVNYGGAWAESVFRQAQSEMRTEVPVQVVHATRSKMARAEPVAALYERGKVRHVGEFPELEDQLVNYTGAAGEKSPDRLDSLVHALAPFTTRSLGPPVPDHLDQAVPYSDVVRGTDYAGELDGAVPWR